jgi:hypothetical protein
VTITIRCGAHWPWIFARPYRLTLTRAILVLAGGLTALSALMASWSATGADAPTLAIIQPSHLETLHDNLGNVTVVVTLQGAALSAGRHLRVLLDGKSYATDLRALQFTLHRVARGEHALQVMLVDESMGVIATSPAIRFYLWLASRLFNKT